MTPSAIIGQPDDLPGKRDLPGKAPRGQARAAVLALGELARAVGRVEELMSAMARGLDSEVP